MQPNTFFQRPIQHSSVTQSCLTPCNSVDCSTPGFPVHHQLPELAQTQVHWVGDAIQPSHPLSSPSLPAFNLSQHQGLYFGVVQRHNTPVFSPGKFPWTEEPGRLQSMGSQRVKHNLATKPPPKTNWLSLRITIVSIINWYNYLINNNKCENCIEQTVLTFKFLRTWKNMCPSNALCRLGHGWCYPWASLGL